MIQLRDLALCRNDGSGYAIVGAEIRVSRGDDTADETPIGFVVEKSDDLLGYCAATTSAAISRCNQDKWSADANHSVFSRM